MNVSPLVSQFMQHLSQCCSRPLLTHLALIMTTRILAIGASTITNLSRICGLNPYASPWHQVFSRYSFNLWQMSEVILGLIIKCFLQGNTIVLAIDDTTCLHKGKSVFGRAKHRDGVRSSHSVMIPLLGHKWVVVCVIVKLGISHRHWALPIAVGLCRSSEFAKMNCRRHKTPAHIARLLIAKIQRKFSKYRFIIVGDQGYGQHATACAFSSDRLTLVSKFYPDAALYMAPPRRKRGTNGRPPTKGPKLPRPVDAVRDASLKKTTTTWYGGKPRNVEYTTGTGYWWRSGHDIVQVRWVFVRDLSGTHRDEYLYSTDVTMSPATIISLYTARWAIEVSFQECKQHLRIEKTRVWAERSVLTLIPLLFGCYTAIVILGAHSSDTNIRWPKKETIAFSDILLTLRRTLWKERLFQNSPDLKGPSKFNATDQETILRALCQAA